jgi:hypothetical protein
MPKTPLIWDTAAKKEALQLMQAIWTSGSSSAREKLLTTLQQGPPAHLPILYDNEEDRERSRARRVYERLSLLLRVDAENPELISTLKPLQERYPHWRLPEGEQATFTSWMEARHGPETRHSVSDLTGIEDQGELIQLLMSEEEYREGLLDTWRRVVNSEPSRGLNLLDALRREREGGKADIWRVTLWGIRENTKEADTRHSLIGILSEVPDSLFEESEFTESIAGLLESLVDPDDPDNSMFWSIFDRTLDFVENDPENSEVPSRGNWVDLAINRSLGRLATAFFDALYTYKLKVGGGLPAHQIERFDRILSVGRPDHRLARVIAASRLPYLFAVDPNKTARSLLPSFSWSDETEATAAWQGFCWSPTVSPDLWLAIRDDFVGTLVPERLAKLGDAGRTIAQLLVMVGLEFPGEALGAEQTRAAIRTMPDELRHDALWWIWNYIGRRAENDEGDRADRLWRDRLQPWLRRNWPRDHTLRSTDLSERFALIAISTNEAFPEAVTFFDSLFVKGRDAFALHELLKSAHPENHAHASLHLVTRTITPDGYWNPAELRQLLQRFERANPQLVDEPHYKEWDRQLRSRGA